MRIENSVNAKYAAKKNFTLEQAERKLTQLVAKVSNWRTSTPSNSDWGQVEVGREKATGITFWVKDDVVVNVIVPSLKKTKDE